MHNFKSFWSLTVLLPLIDFCFTSSECYECALNSTKQQSNCSNTVKCHDKYVPCLTLETLKKGKEPTYIKGCGTCKVARILNDPGKNGVFHCWECFYDKCNIAKLNPV